MTAASDSADDRRHAARRTSRAAQTGHRRLDQPTEPGQKGPRDGTQSRPDRLRHIRSSLAGTNPHPGVRKLWRFLRITRKYYIDASAKTAAALDDDGAITRALTVREIAPYADKLIRCSDSADVSSFLSSVR